MTWFSADAPTHEGYAVALVEHESGHMVELHHGAHRQWVTQLQAACDCGWRSTRQRVPPVEWDGIVLASTNTFDRLALLWEEHIALVLYHERVNASDADPNAAYGGYYQAVSGPLVKALTEQHRCHCGHKRRHHGPRGCVHRNIESIGCTCTCTGFRFRPERS